jgi:hypothetical protein
MNEQKDDGGPAFPCDQIELGDRTVRSEGMTLRDYFAAKAISSMAGLEQERYLNARDACLRSDMVARHAYLFADSMLKARQR